MTCISRGSARRVVRDVRVERNASRPNTEEQFPIRVNVNGESNDSDSESFRTVLTESESESNSPFQPVQKASDAITVNTAVVLCVV